MLTKEDAKYLEELADLEQEHGVEATDKPKKAK